MCGGREAGYAKSRFRHRHVHLSSVLIWRRQRRRRRRASARRRRRPQPSTHAKNAALARAKAANEAKLAEKIKKGRAKARKQEQSERPQVSPPGTAAALGPALRFMQLHSKWLHAPAVLLTTSTMFSSSPHDLLLHWHVLYVRHRVCAADV